MFVGSWTADSPGGVLRKSGRNCAVTESYVHILMRLEDDESTLVEGESWMESSNSEPKKSSRIVCCSALRFSVMSIRGASSGWGDMYLEGEHRWHTGFLSPHYITLLAAC